MAGSTGMGDALHELEAQYKKVDWNVFDMQLLFPRGSKEFTLPKLANAMQAAVKNAAAAKLRTVALEARDVAKATEKAYKANTLVPKSATALCASIVKAAEGLAVAANPNSLSGYIAPTAKIVREMWDGTADNIRKNYDTHVSKLAVAFTPVANDPSFNTWRDANIMTLVRNVTQQVGNVSKLIARGYNLGLDVKKCDVLFKGLTIYASEAVPFAESAPEKDRKDHVKTMLLLLKSAKEVK